MTEVTAKLQGCGVYLAGESVSCVITFTNHGSSDETLAWVSAQIHCQACFREDVVSFSTSKLSPRSPATDTTFVPNRGEKGHTLLSTPTTVLFCNHVLKPGDSECVTYSEQVPSGGPPSFSGRLAKYSYKLTIGAQKPGCSARITRLPFRVMVIPESLYTNYVRPSPKNVNPFLVSEVKEDPTLELALQALAAETSKRTSLNYTLKNPHGILGRISLFKSSYKLGEDITGALDLTTGTIACLQMTVVLQCLEEVSKSSLQTSAVVNSTCSVHARHLECCHNTRQSHFSLPVPLAVTQSFQHPTVSVRWQLHFEFLISRTTPNELMKATPTASLSGSSATLWKKEEPVTVDTMTWDLPVNILPTWPEQAEPLTQTQQHSII